MARILIVEDEVELANGLKDNFEFDGDQVVCAHDGEEGLRLAREGNVDLIVLDVMLPRKSGFDVCRQLRAEGFGQPVIMLTARSEEVDKILGLELGADDYMTKPFSVRELLARVRALLRRCAPRESGEDTTFTIGKLTVDLEHYTASDPDGEVKMTHREFELLRFFRRNATKTIDRDDLLQEVWGYTSLPTTRTVDNFIARLRKKIEEDPANPRHLLTVHGTGYKYVP